MSEPRKKHRLAINAQLRFRVLERDSFKCVYCGMPGTHCVLEVDHVVPVARGGTNELANLAASCADCNAGKSSRVVPLDQLPDAVAQRMHEADIAHRRNIATMVAARLFRTPMPHPDLWLESLMTDALMMSFDEMARLVDEVLAMPLETNTQRFRHLKHKIDSFICLDDETETQEVIEDAA